MELPIGWSGGRNGAGEGNFTGVPTSRYTTFCFLQTFLNFHNSPINFKLQPCGRWPQSTVSVQDGAKDYSYSFSECRIKKEYVLSSHLMETSIMAKMRYFPRRGTTREVGGMISTTSRKNTYRLVRIEMERVTCKAG